MSDSRVNDDTIEQLFPRCQPRQQLLHHQHHQHQQHQHQQQQQSSVKRQKQKRRLNRAKAPQSGPRYQRAGVGVAAQHPPQLVASFTAENLPSVSNSIHANRLLIANRQHKTLFSSDSDCAASESRLARHSSDKFAVSAKLPPKELSSSSSAAPPLQARRPVKERRQLSQSAAAATAVKQPSTAHRTDSAPAVAAKKKLLPATYNASKDLQVKLKSRKASHKKTNKSSTQRLAAKERARNSADLDSNNDDNIDNNGIDEDVDVDGGPRVVSVGNSPTLDSSEAATAAKTSRLSKQFSAFDIESPLSAQTSDEDAHATEQPVATLEQPARIGELVCAAQSETQALHKQVEEVCVDDIELWTDFEHSGKRASGSTDASSPNAKQLDRACTETIDFQQQNNGPKMRTELQQESTIQFSSSTLDGRQQHRQTNTDQLFMFMDDKSAEIFETANRDERREDDAETCLSRDICKLDLNCDITNKENNEDTKLIQLDNDNDNPLPTNDEEAYCTTSNNLPTHSSMHFNALSDSDNESLVSDEQSAALNSAHNGTGNDASMRPSISGLSLSGTNYNSYGGKKSETLVQSSCQPRALATSKKLQAATDAASTVCYPTAKVSHKRQASPPIVFPRIDEGLSSDPESCYEDSNDDERRAADADIDDDDDDDLDEQDDDDFESYNGTVNNILSYCEPNVINGNSSTSASNRLVQSGAALQQNSLPVQFANHSSSGVANDSFQYQPTNPKQVQSYLDPHHHDISMDHMKGDYFAGSNHSSDAIDKQLSSVYDTTTASNGLGHRSQNTNYWLNPSQQHAGNQNSFARNCQLSTQAPSPGLLKSQQTSNKVYASSKDKETKLNQPAGANSDTDNETDRLLGTQRSEQLKLANKSGVAKLDSSSSSSAPLFNNGGSSTKKASSNQREVLIEGVLFNVKFLGTTILVTNGWADRTQQAQMAVHEVRSRNEPSSPSDVQLFISTEKIMILDNEQQKIATTFDLKTISYIADIDEFFVLIVRETNKARPDINSSNINTRTGYELSCHVFESHESHTITKSINQAFQVAFAEMKRVHGFGAAAGNADSSYMTSRENDLQEVLNSQEMSFEELELFACKENHKRVIVPKKKGEILGLSIVESGWGSMLPTVRIANLKPNGPAERCKELTVGDHLMSINGNSLVGLSKLKCEEFLKRTRNQTVARLVVVPGSITVDVKIKRPDTKIQLGFSVQNGVICSLLRGGIAERGGVRVGHKIISINGTRVVGVPHEKIVSLLASSVGEIRMETCLTSLYRLILGEDNPLHQ